MAVRIERMTLHSFFFLIFFYFSTDLIRVAITSKVRRLKHFHHSNKGLT